MRQAIFTVLGSLPPASRIPLAGASVADLFAGSGALGIEALSRGAGQVTFVDADRAAAATIEANLVALGLGGRGGDGVTKVIRGDALTWAATASRTDLVLCDPPYAYDRWAELLSRLHGVARLAVLESGGPIELSPGWELVREKRYGSTVVTVVHPAHPSDSARNPKGDL